MRPQYVAWKYVNVMDRVEPRRPVVVPAFVQIKRVDTKPERVENFSREKTRDATPAWQEFNDLTLSHLVGLDIERKGDCE